MPRVNLTEAEAEAIRAQRELAAAHNATYNRALDDVLAATKDLAYPDGIAEEVERLRRK